MRLHFSQVARQSSNSPQRRRAISMDNLHSNTSRRSKNPNKNVTNFRQHNPDEHLLSTTPNIFSPTRRLHGTPSRHHQNSNCFHSCNPSLFHVHPSSSLRAGIRPVRPENHRTSLRNHATSKGRSRASSFSDLHGHSRSCGSEEKKPIL